MAPRVILIADYHDDSRIVYSTILQYDGFVVFEARNGAEALEMVPRHMPDVVIMEVTLPVLDGCEVLRRLKQHPLTCHIAVLVITADSSPAIRGWVEEAGCDAYLLKPCTPSEVLVAARALLDRSIPPSLV